ncbi:flavodoxin family protein BilS [Senegalimassilia anaerobia]|uniref:flavodoxin family protein BilS n=1 Tax=Senegalimassilia anaerobia TaxID=1473216 RepID=UPI00248EF376|nr:flavodoxin family protein BilS [Senegalimassilia anaerobia]
MNGKGYSIVFSSRTGNTAELAEAVRAALPEGACECFGSVDGDGNCDCDTGCAGDGDRNGSSFGSSTGTIPASETLFVGFWTNQGVADQAAQKLLEQLKDRKIFLFGTAGFGGSEAYFQAILDKTKAFIDDSNTVIGTFMCQGKMPHSVRERYVKMKEQPDHMPNLDAMIENFDKALFHPDANDLEKLANLVSEIFGQ